VNDRNDLGRCYVDMKGGGTVGEKDQVTFSSSRVEAYQFQPPPQAEVQSTAVAGTAHLSTILVSSESYPGRSGVQYFIFQLSIPLIQCRTPRKTQMMTLSHALFQTPTEKIHLTCPQNELN